MTNSPKMTLEEKITQTIKTDSLMALVGDEDAITDLVKRAITEALYQPTRVPRQYGGYEDKDSIVVAAARTVAKEAADKIADQIITKLIETPEIIAEIQKTIMALLPQAIINKWDSRLNDAVNMQSMHAIQNLNDVVTKIDDIVAKNNLIR